MRLAHPVRAVPVADLLPAAESVLGSGVLVQTGVAHLPTRPAVLVAVVLPHGFTSLRIELSPAESLGHAFRVEGRVSAKQSRSGYGQHRLAVNTQFPKPQSHRFLTRSAAGHILINFAFSVARAGRFELKVTRSTADPAWSLPAPTTLGRR